MKKNTIFMCLSLGLAGLLSSCSSFDNPYEPKEVASEKGLLTLNLASGVEFTTRAANESDWTNLENYNITIKKEGGEAVTKPYSEWGFPWACDEGTYSVTAFKGEEKAYSHDTFYATGNGSCTVEKGKESKAEITVSPTAGKVIVEYDPELSTYCSDYSIDFSGTTAMGSEIAHTDKANNEGPWYFALKKGGETVNYTINLTAKSDYTKEGIESFREFINDRSLLRMFNAGEYILYGAYLKDELAGMISIREQTHISLLFVDEIHHRKGIGRCLINAAKEMEEDMGYDLLTVNAAPYAIGFYHRLGFVDTDIARVKEGITYTSMQLDF